MSTNESELFYISNQHNPMPFKISVLKDSTLEQYIITIEVYGNRFSRTEKSRVKAVEIAKQISLSIEHAFQYTWEDRT